MSENLKNILSSSDCLSHQMMKDYISNKLSDADKYYVELHISSCEMCADELEGIMLINDNGRFDNIVEGINLEVAERVAKKKSKKKRAIMPWMIRLAAAVIVLLLISTVLYVSYFNKNVSTKSITENVVKSEDQKNSRDINQDLGVKTGVVKEIESLNEQEKSGTIVKDIGGLDIDNNEESDGFIFASGETTEEEVVMQEKDLEAEETNEDVDLLVVDEITSFEDRVSDTGKKKAEEKTLLKKEVLKDKEETLEYSYDDRNNREAKLDEKKSPHEVETVELASNVERKESIVSRFFSKNKEPENVPLVGTFETDALKQQGDQVTVSGKDNDKTEYEMTIDSTVVLRGGWDVPEESKSNLTRSTVPDKAASATTGASGDGTIDYYSIAMNEYDNKNYQTAIDYFEKILVEDPYNYPALFYAAVAYIKSSQPQKALTYLEKVLMIKEGEFYEEARFRKSEALIEYDQPAKAKLILDEIIKAEGEFKGKAEELLEEIK